MTRAREDLTRNPQKIFMDDFSTKIKISRLEMEIRKWEKKYEEANQKDYVFREKKFIRATIRNLSNELNYLQRTLDEVKH